jgi:hypothetical protein
MGIGGARGRGKAMSAGHSMRRQNYRFVTITPPDTHSTPSEHFTRVYVAVLSAIVLTFATFATIAMLGAGR